MSAVNFKDEKQANRAPKALELMKINPSENLLRLLFQIIFFLLEEIQTLRTQLFTVKSSVGVHRPPSSEGLSKKRGRIKRGTSGRKPGGQKGHPGIARTEVPPQQISETVIHIPQSCQNCGVSFCEDNEKKLFQRHQILEIPPIKPQIIEHQFYSSQCPCGYCTHPVVPQWIYCGIGEALQSLIVYLTAEVKLSRRSLQTLLREVFHMPIAVGTLQNRLEDTSEILQPVYEKLETQLAREKTLNIDETSYPHNKSLAWLWAFVTSRFVFFTLQTSRGSKVIRQTIGKVFDGIIICDRFSAYVKYHKDRACGLLQFCWAHLIRDIKAFELKGNRCGTLFSMAMRQRIGAVFGLWHAYKNGKVSRQKLWERAQPLILEIRQCLERTVSSPCKELSGFSGRLLKKWDCLFTFIHHEGVEPTNNLAERSIRPAVQTRKISYCTRSEKGQLLRARLLTVTQSCKMQGRNSYEFFREAIHAHRNGLPLPSLLVKSSDAELRLAA